jgi:4-hydroxybenzoate polyprenyltransferase
VLRQLRGLTVVHPFPSALNALLVLALATLAGGTPLAAAGLAAAMLLLQFTIGSINDLCDEELDAAAKPYRPIPAGLVERRTAFGIALVCAMGAMLLAAAFGLPVLAMAALMLGAGLAYDTFLKRGPWAWSAYAVAFPILPLYAWYGASGDLPPRYELVVPLAALAGPALHLANGLVDLHRDRRAGLVTPVGWLGHRRALAVMVLLLGVIYGLAWLTLAGGGGVSPAALGLLGLATALAAIGALFSASGEAALRERGWQVQAAGIVLLATGWLVAVAT